MLSLLLFTILLTFMWYILGFILAVGYMKLSSSRYEESDINVIGILAFFGPLVIFGILGIAFINFMDRINFWSRLARFINTKKDDRNDEIR